ncbi:fibrinolytic enzyme isozyme C [Biomphalaria pfeifferi]|uniref:Fibrinolytic enzyme isozyme C n=1 Tax=Biomphalaria pfeifferi TaxID=112525 RepID=A0AAD8BSW7_BIOPF|nr:fibrinolytic enzyme isozyme C [Biomphalaria pfeifferi]
MTTLRKLDELSCKQLKEELRARYLRIFCAKVKMRASLRQALVDEREDPEIYFFEVDLDICNLLKTMQESLQNMNDSIRTQIKQLSTMRGVIGTIQHPIVTIQDLMKEKTDELMGTMLSKTDELMNKKDEALGTILSKTDEPIYGLLNKTDELMATMSRRINDPLLNGDADNGSAVRDCDNELCKSSSNDKKLDHCCEYHKDEHRPDYVQVILAAYPQAFYEICADGTSQGDCKYQKTCPDPTGACAEDITSERSPEGGQKNPVRRDASADECLHIRHYPCALQACLPDAAGFGELFDNLTSRGPPAKLQSIH